MSTESSKTSGTQKAVKIDDDLFYDLDEWLKSEAAKKSGYHSKAQFANEAIGKLLGEKKKSRFTNITTFGFDMKIMMIDNLIKPPDDPRVTLDVKYGDNADVLCTLCNEIDCEHVRASRHNTKASEYIEYVQNYEPDEDDLLEMNNAEYDQS